MDIPLTIKETQEGLLEKKFSAVELVDSYLARINKHNKDLNIFITVTKEEAYKKAKEIDNLLSQNNPNIRSDYPLLGATVAYKDIYLTKGVRTTAASRVLETYIPSYSGTVVERIQNAGGIMMGKANCDAWAHGASGENSDYGPTKNPWNTKMVSGGSSSGSAASLAAEMSLIAMGSDTGGSTRQPANFCNLVGLKPTYGAISRYGVIAMSSSIDTIGTFGHTIADVESIFNVIKGEDGFDSTVKNFSNSEVNKKFKLGIAKEYFIEGLDKEVKTAVESVVKTYKKMGIEVIEINLPHTKYMAPVYYIVQPAEVSSNLSRYDGIRYGNKRSEFGDEAKRRIMLGTYVLSTGYYDKYYLTAQKVRSKLIEDFEHAFKSVDAIISPVSPTTAFKIGEKSNDPLKMYLEDIYTAVANLVGIPGLAVPIKFSSGGLPIGFQLMGPRFSEHTLFTLGKMFEKGTNYKPQVAKYD